VIMAGIVVFTKSRHDPPRIMPPTPVEDSLTSTRPK
jgi:hypothetical protein